MCLISATWRSDSLRESRHPLAPRSGPKYSGIFASISRTLSGAFAGECQMEIARNQTGDKDDSERLSRRDFLVSTGGSLAVLGALQMPALGAEPRREPELESMRLSSGR